MVAQSLGGESGQRLGGVAGRVGELVQPVGLGLAGEQLVGAVADSFGAVATGEAVVVQVEADQVQVVTAQMPAEEEVVPQTAVDVFHHGTGPDRVVRQSGDSGADRMEPFTQLAAQRGFGLPVFRRVRGEHLDRHLVFRRADTAAAHTRLWIVPSEIAIPNTSVNSAHAPRYEL